MENAQYCFYFAPHQDDELCNFGAAICRDLDAGKKVVCVLCTDGSASGARRLIGNGERCHLHEGLHPQGFGAPDFVAARDREFRACCAALGIPAAGIVIPANRAQDGALSVEHAGTLMLEAIGSLPPQTVTVKTFAPVDGCRQNPDHTAVGAAAQALFRAGRFGGLSQFYELIHLDGRLGAASMVFLRPETNAQKKRLREAAACYNRWEPENGFFAVGYHSVFDEFAAFTADPFSLLKV